MSTARIISMPREFVDSSRVHEDPSYRLANPDLKYHVKHSPYLYAALLKVICNACRPHGVALDELSEASLVEAEDQNAEALATNHKVLFNAVFEVVPGSEGDWISTSDISLVLKPAKLSNTRLGLFLKSKGCIKGKKRSIETAQDGSQKHVRICGYRCIRRKDDSGRAVEPDSDFDE